MKLEKTFLSIINPFVSTIISRSQNKPAGFYNTFDCECTIYILHNKYRYFTDPRGNEGS